MMRQILFSGKKRRQKKKKKKKKKKSAVEPIGNVTVIKVQ